MSKLIQTISSGLKDIFEVFTLELHRIFTDGGVMLIFFVATLLYPLIFGAIYKHELVRNLPVAVVDDSRSASSRRFIHKLDATPEVNVDFRCNTLEEAETLMHQRKINGIFYFPKEYNDLIVNGEQARLCLFCDMSSFLYYRSVFTGASSVMLDEMRHIQLERYAMAGTTGADAEEMIAAIPYDDVKLFSPAGGFTSFLVPALLALVIHQTLFLGICILSGTIREEGQTVNVIPERLRNRSVYRVVLGRSLAYIMIYIPLIAIDLVLLPRVFGLPHIGRLGDLCLFLLPFMLATVAFSMTVGMFIRERDTVVLTCIFFSVVLLFLSGVVWPRSNMPAFWRYFSYLFPSTHGIQGFVRINSMGAQLKQVQFEYLMLWIQAGGYFLLSCLFYRLFFLHERLKQEGWTFELNGKRLSLPLQKNSMDVDIQ